MLTTNRGISTPKATYPLVQTNAEPLGAASGITVTPSGHNWSMELEGITPAEPAEGWQQPQLLTTPLPRATARPRATAGAWGNATKSNPRLRQVGLVGIAQAREALAEAARRAELRADHKAA
jgi:hypothetical protein